jgi:acyl carrier protein
MSAIQNTIARGRKTPCYVGSVKSNMGHLESAAGIAGLIKSVAILNHGMIPPNLHFHQPNAYIDFDTHNIRVVAEETEIDPQAAIGVSSFGFGGTNAHIIIKGADASVRKEIRPLKIPFDREKASSLASYIQGPKADTAASDIAPEEKEERTQKTVTREDIDRMVAELFFQLTSIDKIDPEIELTDQGLDSMSGTELISQLETSLNIEIDPEILFEHPFRDQFVDEVYALSAGNRN